MAAAGATERGLHQLVSNEAGARPWVSLPELRARLPRDGAAFLDIVRMRVIAVPRTCPKKKHGGPRIMSPGSRLLSAM